MVSTSFCDASHLQRDSDFRALMSAVFPNRFQEPEPEDWHVICSFRPKWFGVFKYHWEQEDTWLRLAVFVRWFGNYFGYWFTTVQNDNNCQFSLRHCSLTQEASPKKAPVSHVVEARACNVNRVSNWPLKNIFQSLQSVWVRSETQTQLKLPEKIGCITDPFGTKSFFQKHLWCLGSRLVDFPARGAIRKRREGGREGNRRK